MSGWLDGPILNVLQKGLEASSLRQQVLSDNIANVDTPNFKRSDVDFQVVLNQALGNDGGELPLKQTSKLHLPGITGDSSSTGVVTDTSTSMRQDGNNVDIDKEMTNVAENNLYYDAMSQTLSSQLGLLRLVIK